MAGLPSHLFVVRHGNRLDTADKRWHLSSPTPYDPPLTYGGFLQARQVGNHIANILEQIKFEAEHSKVTPRKRRRFRVVIHTSPFLRCIQTSIGISSGLSQAISDTSLRPYDLVVPVEAAPGTQKSDCRTSILRIDSFLGEWLSEKYFENITPPPGSSLMLGTAKANLLKREDYSSYTDFPPRPQEQPPPPRKSSLWNSPSGSASPASDKAAPFGSSGSSSALNGQSGEKKGYNPPRPTYAVSSNENIPNGFAAHARDNCLTFDYQWDSMRPPYDFGDGGHLPEEWPAMHQRFRKGLKRMLNWYASAEAPAQTDAPPANNSKVELDEEIETVVIIVSHGAGCNALIGAITHQPVLMDVGLASLTMAVRKEGLNYAQLSETTKARDPSGNPLVHVDHMYDIRLSASTEHLRSTTSTPISARSSSATNVLANTVSRGRTSTLGSTASPPNLGRGLLGFHDPLSSGGSRCTSASPSFGTSSLRDSAPNVRVSPMVSNGALSGPGSSGSRPSGLLPQTSAPPETGGLWRPPPPPSSLRLMDDGTGNANKEDDGFPNFDQTRISETYTPEEAYDPMDSIGREGPEGLMASSGLPKGPLLAAPIKLQTNWGNSSKTEAEKKPQQVAISELEDGMGGLWGQPPSPEEAERLRDLSHTKRRWTVNERSRP